MQLNSSTNKMFKMMKEAFGNNFMVTDRIIPTEFFSTMFNSLTATIEETRMNFDPQRIMSKIAVATKVRPEIPTSKVTIRARSKAPIFPKIRQYEVDDVNFWKEFVEEIEKRVLVNNTELVIDPTVIGTGKTSQVYKLFDKQRGIDMVCKIDFRTLDGDKVAALESARNRWTSQIYSIYMANLYRRLTCELNAAPIFFLPPVLYELDKPYMGANIVYAEPFIKLDGDWGKYTNNYDYCVK